MKKGLQHDAANLFVCDDIISCNTTFTLNNVNIYKHVITRVQQ